MTKNCAGYLLRTPGRIDSSSWRSQGRFFSGDEDQTEFGSIVRKWGKVEREQCTEIQNDESIQLLFKICMRMFKGS